MAINFLNVGAFPDDVKLTFGAGSDLQIFHNATDSIIYNGTGALMLRGNDVRIQSADASETMATFTLNDRVKLYFDNAVKFETYGAGAGITGNLYFTSGSKIHFDNGVSNDYYIEKSGTALTFNTGGTYTFNTGDATFTGDVIVSGSDTATLSETGLALSRSNSYIQSTSDNSDTLNIGQSSVRWGHVKVDGADFVVLNGGNERFKINSSGNATFAGNVTLGSSSKVSDEWMYIDSDANSSAGIQLLRGGASKWFIYNPGGGNNFKIYDNVGGGYMEIEPVGNVTFSSNILTNTDSSSDIGQTGERWANLWVDSINGGAVVSGSYLPLAGGTMTGDVIFNDSVKALFGTGSDLKVYHDGSAALIDNYTGSLSFREFAANEDIIFFADNGSGGGNITEYFRVDGSLADGTYTYTTWVDNGILGLGTGSDLQLYHTGTDSYISNKTGDLYIKTRDDDKDVIIQSDDGSGGTTTYMLFDGSQTNIHTQVDFRIYDSKKLQLGNSADGEFYSDGSDLYMTNTTGDMYLINKADDKDIIFQSDDGSGGYTTYFQLDGGEGRTVFKQNAIWEDNKAIYMGNAADLRLYHNATDSHIDNYAGNLNIVNNTDDGDINLYCDDGSGSITPYLVLDGSVGYTVAYKDIRFNDGIAAAFGTGIDAFFKHTGSAFSFFNDIGDVTFTQRTDDGDIIFASDNGTGSTSQYFRLDGSWADGTNVFTAWPDNSIIALGDGADLKIYHDASHSYIQEQGTGDLRIEGDSVWIREADGTNQISAYQGTAKLYKDGTERLETTSAGVTITGDARVSGDITVQGGDILNSSGTFTISSAGDFVVDAVGDIKFDADGGDWYFKDAGVNILQLTAGGSSSPTFSASQLNADIIFKGNDGGSTITALTLDMSDAGAAEFGGRVYIPDYIAHVGDSDNLFGFGGTDTFIINTAGTTALTIDSSQDATFAGDVSAVTLTLSGKGTSAATVDGDGSTTMATKGWVESKLTGATLYQGTWDPDVSLNSGYGNPDLSTAALQVNGYYYICSADGTAEPNGTGTEPDTWHTGDWVIWNDDVGVSGEWQKIDNTTVLSGAGTGEYLARWTDTETLGDSVVLTSGEDILIPRYIAHVGDTSTYFGFSGNDTIQFNTNGSERMRIISSGFVGIGETVPEVKLEVAGDIMAKDSFMSCGLNAAEGYQFHDFGSGWGYKGMSGGSGSRIAIWTNGSERLTVNADGEVGIGTTDPQQQLHVYTSSNTVLLVEGNQSTRFATLQLKNAAQSWMVRLEGTSEDFTIRDDTAASEPFRINPATSVGSNDSAIIIDGDANVGIGTTNPDAKLSVTSTGIASEDVLYLKSGADNVDEYLGIAFETGVGGNGPHGAIRVYNGPSGSDAYMSLLTTTDGGTLTQGLTQDHLGNIGIGTSTPGSKLEVVGDIKTSNPSGNTTIQLTSAGTCVMDLLNAQSEAYLRTTTAHDLHFRTTNINRMVVKAGGNVGIGTTTPDAILEVNGGIIAGGKTTYTIVTASVTTTGTAVAGVSTGTNGQSSGFIFTCFGGDSGYQRIIYSCKNVSGTWDINKDIDEGANGFDVTYAADGSDNITFTFKSRSGVTQYYAPKVTVEAIGDQINQSYIN